MPRKLTVLVPQSTAPTSQSVDRFDPFGGGPNPIHRKRMRPVVAIASARQGPIERGAQLRAISSEAPELIQGAGRKPSPWVEPDPRCTAASCAVAAWKPPCR